MPVSLQDPPSGGPRGDLDGLGETETARGGTAARSGTGTGVGRREEHILHGLPPAGRADGAQQGMFARVFAILCQRKAKLRAFRKTRNLPYLLSQTLYLRVQSMILLFVQGDHVGFALNFVGLHSAILPVCHWSEKSKSSKPCVILTWSP